MAKGQKWNPTSLFDPFVIASAKMLLIFCYQTIMCPQCAKFQKKKNHFLNLGIFAPKMYEIQIENEN